MLETGKAPIVATHAAVMVERPLTERQRRLKLAAMLWRNLTEEEMQSWRHYASFYRRYRPTKRRVMGPNARNLFIQATLARWELDTDLPAPVSAPSLPFPRETALIALRLKGSEDANVRITATAPTQPQVMVQLLIQELANINRRPKGDRFRPIAYVRFPEERLSVDVTLPDNVYAIAFRIIDEATLQAGPLQEAGIVVAGKVSRKRTRKTKPVQKIAKVTPEDTERLVNAAFVG